MCYICTVPSFLKWCTFFPLPSLLQLLSGLLLLCSPPNYASYLVGRCVCMCAFTSGEKGRGENHLRDLMRFWDGSSSSKIMAVCESSQEETPLFNSGCRTARLCHQLASSKFDLGLFTLTCSWHTHAGRRKSRLGNLYWRLQNVESQARRGRQLSSLEWMPELFIEKHIEWDEHKPAHRTFSEHTEM